MTTPLRLQRGPSAMTIEAPRSGELEMDPQPGNGLPPEVRNSEDDGVLRPDQRLRAPVALALVAIEVAALMLPKRYRSRYDREFLAELYEMESREQIQFAACVLTQAWRLRAVLRDRPPLDDRDAQR